MTLDEMNRIRKVEKKRSWEIFCGQEGRLRILTFA
jgi:hypothetical protein